MRQPHQCSTQQQQSLISYSAAHAKDKKARTLELRVFPIAQLISAKKICNDLLISHTLAARESLGLEMRAAPG